jgi:Mitochondrial carrier protein
MYEKSMKYFREKYYNGVEKDFEANKTQVNMFCGFLAGVIGSSLTNALDVITINKQTNPKLNIRKLIREERFNLLTKGLMARVCYNSMQSLVLFHIVLKIGDIYNVELSDD